MPSPELGSDPADEPHQHRSAAESFGADAERYDRARPRYPEALIERIAAAAPSGLVLDIGAGTGIVARQLEAAGCHVIGVDPDARLAAFARHSGVEVEVATFEDWDPAGRRFDSIVSAESWHWVDPAIGMAKAADLLRPGGRLYVFWNTGQPSGGVAEAFAAVYRTVLPASFADRLTPHAMEVAHDALCTKTTDAMQATGAFAVPEQWRFEWAQTYTRAQWLDALHTSGGAIPETLLTDLLDGIGDAIDAVGGSFTLNYRTLVVTAARA